MYVLAIHFVKNSLAQYFGNEAWVRKTPFEEDLKCHVPFLSYSSIFSYPWYKSAVLFYQAMVSLLSTTLPFTVSTL